MSEPSDIPVVPCQKCGGAALDLRVQPRPPADSINGRCLYRSDRDYFCANTGEQVHAVGGGTRIAILEVSPTETIDLAAIPPGAPPVFVAGVRAETPRVPAGLATAFEPTTRVATIRFPGKPLPRVVDVFTIPNGTVQSTCCLCGMSFTWGTQAEADFWAASHDGLHRTRVYQIAGVPTKPPGRIDGLDGFTAMALGMDVVTVAGREPDPSIREVVERKIPISKADLEDPPAFSVRDVGSIPDDHAQMEADIATAFLGAELAAESFAARRPEPTMAEQQAAARERVARIVAEHGGPGDVVVPEPRRLAKRGLKGGPVGDIPDGPAPALATNVRVRDVHLSGSALIHSGHWGKMERQAAERNWENTISRARRRPGSTIHLMDLVADARGAGALDFIGGFDEARGGDLVFGPDEIPGRLVLHVDWRTAPVGTP